MGAFVRVKLDPTQKILLKRSLGKDGSAGKFFATEYARQMDPYVPYMEHGGSHLKSNIDISSMKIVYRMPYARKNFYENRGLGVQGINRGGKRGKRWDQRCWADHGDEIVKAVAAHVGGKPGK
jgi:hypothetical protein